jgi:O-antigen/teichoic acid export membrane protein
MADRTGNQKPVTEPALVSPHGIGVSDALTEPVVGAPPRDELAKRVVLGTVVQQAGQVMGLVVGLVTVTVLARHLTLAQFGVYGFITSLATYAFFALGSAETAAIKAISAATDQLGRDRAYTTAVVVYSGLGLVAGILIAGGGQLLIAAFQISSALRHEARIGIVALGAATGVGFPLRLHQDLLRASQRFTLAGVAESLGWCALGATVLVLLLMVRAPIWAVAAAGGAIPAFLGLTALLVVRIARVPYRLRPSLLTRAGVRGFLGVSSYMFFISSSDVLITSLDRTVLAAFRSVATVGLYEGAARLNNLVRAFTGSLSITLLPISARLAADGDREREHELLVRGTRYMLAAVVPPTVALMVLADRLLAVWLGPKFSAAGPAAIIFMIWWLLAPNSAVASTLMVVESRFRRMAVYSWTIAIVNLVVSLALTPLIGLDGVAAGTTAGYLSVFPFFLRFVFQRHGLSVREFARGAWLPAYGTGAVLAAVLLAVRQVVTLDSVPVVLGVAAAAVLLAWVALYALLLSAQERAMFRRMLRRSAPDSAGP